MWRCFRARSRKREVILQEHFIINSVKETYRGTFRPWDILDNFKATWPHVLQLAAPHVCCRTYLITQSQTLAVWPSEPVDLNSHDFSYSETSDGARKHRVSDNLCYYSVMFVTGSVIFLSNFSCLLRVCSYPDFDNWTGLWRNTVVLIAAKELIYICISFGVREPGQLATGWTVRCSNSGGGEIFRTCRERFWGSPSLLYNGYRVFPGGKVAGA